MIQGGPRHRRRRQHQSAGVSMFRAHGRFSNPSTPGKNIINPLAAICAVAMMLETLGEAEAGKAIDQAVSKFLAPVKIKSLAAGKWEWEQARLGTLFAKGVLERIIQK